MREQRSICIQLGTACQDRLLHPRKQRRTFDGSGVDKMLIEIAVGKLVEQPDVLAAGASPVPEPEVVMRGGEGEGIFGVLEEQRTNARWTSAAAPIAHVLPKFAAWVERVDV